MDLGLTGRVAIVEGASKGLGRATAQALAEEGAALVICSRGADALELARRELSELGGRVVALALDAADLSTPGTLVGAALGELGRLDIVVSNSGGPPPARALELTDDEIGAAVESNLLGHVRLVRAALPHLRERSFGRICMIASYGVVQPIPTLALSNLARSGLRAWAKTAAADLAGSGVTLNLVAPGLHLTDRTRQLGHEPGTLMGDAGDFGRVVAFMCSQSAGFVNGATIVVDGGATLAL